MVKTRSSGVIKADESAVREHEVEGEEGFDDEEEVEEGFDDEEEVALKARKKKGKAVAHHGDVEEPSEKKSCKRKSEAKEDNGKKKRLRPKYPNMRCAPMRLYDTMVKIKKDDAKRKDIEDIGLGCLIEMNGFVLHRGLVNALFGRFDPKNMVLRVHGLELNVSAKDVEHVLGLKDRGLDIKKLCSLDAQSDLQQCRADLGFERTGEIFAGYLEERITSLPAGLKHKAAFLLYALLVFLRPETGMKVSDLMIRFLPHIGRLKKFNWASYVLDGIVEWAEKVAEKPRGYIGGCGLFLMVSLMDWKVDTVMREQKLILSEMKSMFDLLRTTMEKIQREIPTKSSAVSEETDNAFTEEKKNPSPKKQESKTSSLKKQISSLSCRRTTRNKVHGNVITEQSKKIDSTTFESYLHMYMNASTKEKVLGWIKKKQIFSKKYVIVPIVIWNHWNLLILCNFDESMQSKTRTPCMMLLDSLEKADPKRLEPDIRKFVWDIYQTEGRPEDRKSIYRIPFLVPKVPQQRDDEECGTFVLYFINRFVQDAPENFNVKDFPYFVSFCYCCHVYFFKYVDALQSLVVICSGTADGSKLVQCRQRRWVL
ncbi:Cysteine proteinases superfamily protein putative isoform 3 [Tripterygium wilfordii]|uniref:Cysteine proteinases superfamily protein putative isoform 3 n=1 Tax=Tripterygium wilfordii TaxID=458696 RepID=A0A7J7D3W0_TRIWF|nr:Cysteine proteinases superfamily protein putative isoform 3 [Tripterygium wilfordii]